MPCAEITVKYANCRYRAVCRGDSFPSTPMRIMYMKKALLTSLILLALNAQAESVFRRGNSSEPKSIDPQLASESSGSAVIYDNFEG